MLIFQKSQKWWLYRHSIYLCWFLHSIEADISIHDRCWFAQYLIVTEFSTHDRCWSAESSIDAHFSTHFAEKSKSFHYSIDFVVNSRSILIFWHSISWFLTNWLILSSLDEFFYIWFFDTISMLIFYFRKVVQILQPPK